MGYSKKLMFLMIFFISGLTCVGCSSLEDYIRKNQSEALSATEAKLDVIIIDVEKYIGKNKEELRKSLGEPSQIICPSLWKGVKYDEEWVYEKGIPFVNKQYRMFYIKGGIVAHVELGGVF